MIEFDKEGIRAHIAEINAENAAARGHWDAPLCGSCCTDYLEAALDRIEELERSHQCPHAPPCSECLKKQMPPVPSLKPKPGNLISSKEMVANAR